jgi:hypothetical protein
MPAASPNLQLPARIFRRTLRAQIPRTQKRSQQTRRTRKQNLPLYIHVFSPQFPNPAPYPKTYPADNR